MDYIYDIVLNFQPDYYDFYEWSTKDKIINVKRVPIYKISNRDYLNIKYNNCVIDKQSLSKQSKIFLLTSGIEIMGILIDNNGKVLKKSSLIFEESDDILEDRDEIKKIEIKYHITKKNDIIYESRATKEKKHYIRKYLNNLNKEKDEYLLKYLYFEIFNNEEKDINIVYNKLLELSKKNISKMYESINKINLELKK